MDHPLVGRPLSGGASVLPPGGRAHYTDGHHEPTGWTSRREAPAQYCNAQSMNKLTSIFVAVAVLTISVFGVEKPEKLSPKERFHLYLLIGQSNMAGRGKISLEYAVPSERILKFSKENTWVPGMEPLHFDKPAVAGAGLGMSFARTMADAEPGASIGLIPCAVGGTPLAHWMKGGDLYRQALQRARLAMRDGTIKGILWHQGEGDSGREETARSYGERLAKMVTELRADLGAGDVPFVAGKLGEFLKRESKSGNPTYWPVVNEQIATLPQRVPCAAVVESTGLKHRGDQLHFDTPSLREFGKRYAAAMQRLQHKETSPTK